MTSSTRAVLGAGLPVPARAKNRTETSKAIAALGALAQETRLAIFRLLVQCGTEGLPAGAVAENLGVPPGTLSFHLAQLMHAGLIEQRRKSRLLIYSANYDAVNDLIAYLTENCCRCAGPSCAQIAVAHPVSSTATG